MSANVSLPTLREELDRKTLETLEWLFGGHSRGVVSDVAFSAGIDALFKTVSGLVDESFIQMITAAQDLAPVVIEEERRHFIKGGSMVSVYWEPGSEVVRVVRRNAGIVAATNELDHDSPKLAKAKFDELCRDLKKRGLEEL